MAPQENAYEQPTGTGVPSEEGRHGVRALLPEAFCERMRALLGSAYEDYLDSLSMPCVQGIRVNTGKLSAEEFAARAPFALRPVPWTGNGFYVERQADVTRHPYYYAGLYYVQEPSAMLPAALLDVRPGERVLDLCAAPGGKATELGSRLAGEGVLVANDRSNSRAKALLKNLELHGIPNMIVCSEEPKKLLEKFPDFFDKILVDAPCSGEGMFRREPSVIRSYQEHGPAYYAAVQTEILDAAVQMLKPGGRLLYSTCTFSEKENEEVLLAMLKKCPMLRLVPVHVPGAVSLPSLPGCARLFPHLAEGEGHFAALLQKDAAQEALFAVPETNGAGKEERRVSGSPPAKICGGKREASECAKIVPPEWQAFAAEALNRDFSGCALYTVKERLYALPDGISFSGLRCLRTGLYLGDISRHGFEPSQALAMALKREDAKSVVSFDADDPRVLRYLKGETAELSDAEGWGLHGWTLVCVDGFPLGWAKWVNGSFRNKYYAGWRMG